MSGSVEAEASTVSLPSWVLSTKNPSVSASSNTVTLSSPPPVFRVVIVRTPGRMGFPGLYLSGPAATLLIDGKQILPHQTDTVQDPCGGIRLDFSDPVRLEKGLHKIQLLFDYRSKRTGFLNPQPCVRLYWSSEHFLREVVPGKHLVTTAQGDRRGTED